MSLWDQIQSLRTPESMKAHPQEWEGHITSTVIPFLNSVPPRMLATSSSPDPLSFLTPRHDTLPYLFILSERIQASLGAKKIIQPALLPGGELWDKIAHFITECDPIEIRYSGDRWRLLVELLPSIAHFSRASKVPVLKYMAMAILKLDSTAGTLTSSHVLFIRCCLEMQAYPEALLILDHDIHSLPAKEPFDSTTMIIQGLYLSNAYLNTQSKLTVSVSRPEVLQFYLLGAMAYIAMGKWSRASFFLEHVLSTPTNNTASGQMLESYKKWVLVNLMANGKVGPLPRPANGHAMRTVKQAAKHYDSFGEAFDLENNIKLYAEAHEAWSAFVEDGNAGLVKNVIRHHRRLSVSQLAKIYAAVPLAKVSTTLGAPPVETEAYLRSLISEGFLQASIDRGGPGGEAVLRFSGDGSTDQTTQSEEQLRDELIAQTRHIKSLSAHVSEADRKLSMTKEYLDHTRTARRNKEVQGEGGVDEADVSFAGRGPSDEEEDENVMADVR